MYNWKSFLLNKFPSLSAKSAIAPMRHSFARLSGRRPERAIRSAKSLIKQVSPRAVPWVSCQADSGKIGGLLRYTFWHRPPNNDLTLMLQSNSDPIRHERHRELASRLHSNTLTYMYSLALIHNYMLFQDNR